MDAWSTVLPYSAGEVKILALLSDLHLDAEDCDVETLTRDLDQAKRIGARVSINGDLNDLLLPGDLKRYTRATDSTNVDSALNHITKQNVAFLEPYVDLIDVIGVGNHETAALKHHHYDIIAMTIALLNAKRSPSLPPIHQGGYTGFQRYMLKPTTKSRHVAQFDILRFHGSGGGAEVTKGMIDLNRLRATYSADLYWVGHKHTSIVDNGMHEIGMSSKGRVVKRQQRGIFTGGYKKSFVERDYDETGYVLEYSDTKRSSQAPSMAWVALRPTSANHIHNHPEITGIRWNVTDELLIEPAAAK